MRFSPMKHFKPSEFKGWFEQYDELVLKDLDWLRDTCPIRYLRIKVTDCGRRLGPVSRSMHNIDFWGKVYAIDVIPYVKLEDGSKRALTPEEAEVFKLHAAQRFEGIGVYPHWKPFPGFHLDSRQRDARWGDIGKNGKHEYVAIEIAEAEWPEIS